MHMMIYIYSNYHRSSSDPYMQDHPHVQQKRGAPHTMHPPHQ
jgi:hypothetical protein